MTLNLSQRNGPNGRPLLGLKGFSAASSSASSAAPATSEPAPSASLAPQRSGSDAKRAKPAPTLSKAPLGASGEIYHNAIGPQPLPPVWVWLRRKVTVIRKTLPGVIAAGDEIRQRALAAGYDELELNKALRLHFRSRRYAEACAREGAMRQNIDGEPVAGLTDEERQWFQIHPPRWTSKKPPDPAQSAQEPSPEESAGEPNPEQRRNHSSQQPEDASGTLPAPERSSP